jgi:hypothetical protein
MTPPDEHPSNALDGSAVAGQFAEVFAADVSSVTVTCGGCNAPAAFAEQQAFVAGPGTVIRCPGCDHIVARLVQTPDEIWLELRGSSSWRFPFTPPPP